MYLSANHVIALQDSFKLYYDLVDMYAFIMFKLEIVISIDKDINTHILPHIDYCAIICGSSPHTQNLLLAHKRAARVILDIKDIYQHNKDMF